MAQNQSANVLVLNTHKLGHVALWLVSARLGSVVQVAQNIFGKLVIVHGVPLVGVRALDDWALVQSRSTDPKKESYFIA